VKRILFIAALSTSFAAVAHGQTAEQGFVKGPVLEGFGPAAAVDSDLEIPDDMSFKIAFDISEAADEGRVSRRFESVARFINMHAAAGIARERIEPAIVVHGPAAADILKPTDDEEAAPTAALVEALLEEGVPIYLCGQTAAAKGIGKDDLIPGVQLALSAMTAHAVLAEDGYSLNPF